MCFRCVTPPPIILLPSVIAFYFILFCFFSPWLPLSAWDLALTVSSVLYGRPVVLFEINEKKKVKIAVRYNRTTAASIGSITTTGTTASRHRVDVDVCLSLAVCPAGVEIILIAVAITSGRQRGARYGPPRAWACGE